MPDILRGRSVLFASPTASGKTEAAVTPLFQRHLTFRRRFLSTVYVAPTKALVNDLHHRLLSVLGQGHPGAVARYTGDRHELGSAEGRFCVLVTPEALDSLHLRRARALERVRAVVVDEIHLMHGSPRGQQLRHVIDRIRRTSRTPSDQRDAPFQLVGMTATLEDMEEVARIWLGDGARLHRHGRAREIRHQWLPHEPIPGEEDRSGQAAALARWIRKAGLCKHLVFANSRDAAHRLSYHLHRQLQDSRWPVHLHFGALKAAHREKVEESMRSDRFGICVATSTLELGIDIGDVDAILLADLPLSVTSFLQRIGRGNRRSGACQVVCADIPSEPIDELCGSLGIGDCARLREMLFGALLDCARRGELDDVHEYDRPSVRFQQILSLCWRVSRKDRALTLAGLERLAGASGHAPVAEDMIGQGHLKDIRGALVPSDPLLEEGDSGRIHAVIAGGARTQVRDMRDGEAAMSDVQASVHAPSDQVVFLHGEIRRVDPGERGVSYLSQESSPDRGSLARILPASGRMLLSRILLRGLARRMGRDPARWELGPNRLGTWGGWTYNQLVKQFLLQREIGSSFEADDLGIEGLFDAPKFSVEDVRQWSAEAERDGSLPRSLARKFASRSRYLGHLSEDMLMAESLRAVPWRGFRRWLDGIAGIVAAPEEAGAGEGG